MEQLVIKKKSGLEIPLFKSSPLSTVTKAVQRTQLLSEDVVNLSIESAESINIQVSDTIEIFGKVYRINQTPTVNKTASSALFLYDIVFESIFYDLRRPQWMLPETVGFASTGDEPLTADLQGFADVLIYNANRVLGSGTWILGTIPLETEIKTLTFPKEKLLSVLQKLCQEYEIEFEIKSVGSVNTIDFKKVGTILSDAFEHGRGKELYNLQRSNSASSDTVTRLYAFGATKNLKSGYRNYSSRLRMSVNPESYLQDSSIVDPQAEVIESTEYFEDIFPERTGTVSDLVISDINSFIDNSMDFNLNEVDANGTKWLIAQTAAIISFTTGNLAGYEFELKEGGYDHATKTFSIIPFTDERGQKFPDPDSVAFKIKVGDKFKILNINMPDSYVNNAELRLFDKATERLNDVSKRKIQYSLVLNEMFFIKNAPEGAVTNYFNVGDYITILDPDLNVNESIRITALTRDILRPYKYDLTVSESFDISIIYQIIEDNKSIKDVIVKNKLSDPARSRRNWKTTNELSTMLETLRSEMLIIYVEGGAYTTDIASETNADRNVNKFRTTAGVIQHDEYLENGGLWNVSAFEGIMSTNVPYYVYVKASRGNNAASIVLSTTKIKVEQDPMFYHFPYGILSSVFDGARLLSSTKGYTRITGNNIHTGRLVSNDGRMWIDLDVGEIRGTFRFTSGESVEDAISSAEQDAIDAATEYTDTQKQAIDSEMSGLNDSLAGLNTYVDGAFSDNIIEESEAIAIEKYLNALSSEKNSIDNRFTVIYGDAMLTGVPKTNLNSAKTAFNTAHSNLISSINNAIFDKKTTVAEKNDVDAKFETYKNTLATLNTRLEESVNFIGQAKADAAESSATTVADAAASAALDAQADADAANALLTDIASDSKLTAVEKKAVKKEWDGIIAEKATIEAQATVYAITTEKTAFTTAYNSLSTYVTPLLSNLDTVTNIVGTTFRANFSNYYSKRQLLLKAISDKAKSLADAAQSKADSAAAAAVTANNYIDNILPNRLDAIDAALDGLLEQHFFTYNPTNSNVPASAWTTTALKEEHLGDLFYNTSNGRSWRWIKTGTVYSWSEIVNSDLQAALEAASKAQDTADSKRRVFTITPFVPYDVGDLWVQGASGDIMKCKTKKTTSQTYSVSDWEKAAKYTDDAVAQAAAQAAYDAQTDANAANALLTDIASDSKLTAVEKKAVKKEWDIIVSERASIIAQAGTYSIVTTAYTNAYNALNTYITTLLSDLNATSNIVATTFRTNFKTYYDAKIALLKLVTDKAKSIADAAQSTANSAAAAAAQAQTDASTANTVLGKIANDNILMPAEKQDVLQEWQIIQSERSVIASQAVNYSISKADYEAKYATLDTYITPLLSNMVLESAIVGTTFRTRFKAYYDAKVNLLKAISDKAKALVDTAQSAASIADGKAVAAQNTANSAATAATNAQTSANSANTLLTNIASDSKLTASEKQQTKLEWDGIVAEKGTIEAQATLYAITTEKTAFTTAYNSLSTYITPLLSSLTTTSDIVGTTFRANFSNYFSKRQLLLKAISDKAKSLADAAQAVANDVKDKTGIANLPPGTVIIDPSTGSVTANLINTDELIAKKIRTGTTGTRVEININGDAAIRAFNKNGTVVSETFSVVNGLMKVKGLPGIGGRRMEIDTESNEIVFYGQSNKIMLRIEDDIDTFQDNDSARTIRPIAGMIFSKPYTSNPSNPDIVKITANGIYSNASTVSAIISPLGVDGTAYGAIIGYNRRRESLLSSDVNAGIVGLSGISGVYGGFFKHITGGVSLRVDGITQLNGVIITREGLTGSTFEQSIGNRYFLKFVDGIYVATVYR